MGPKEGVEFQLQFVTTVLTNLLMLPGAWVCFRQERFAEGFAGLGTFITSFLYHFCDTTGYLVWGMDSSQWHRLDNVFAITSFCYLAFSMLQVPDRRKEEFLKWLYLVIVVITQEMAPWDELYTVVPVGSAILLVVARWVKERQFPDVEKKSALIALACFCAALVFFTLGLDDHRDYARIYHGCWHCCIGGMVYYALLSNAEFDRKRSLALDLAFGRKDAEHQP